MKITLWLLLLSLAASTVAQQKASGIAADVGAARAVAAERDGVEVRIKDIARFRGVRPNQLRGIGLVIGLEGTGDTKRMPTTANLLANFLIDSGTRIDPALINAQNVALVAVTAELPPFSAPGNRVDVTVQSIGDAKSLQGGYLLQTPLYAQSDRTKAMVVAQGAVSIGGFNASSGGASVQKNHVNVGRVPEGGIVEASVDTKVVFDGALYLELDDADLTTASRLAEKLAEKFPELAPSPVDGGTIRLALPAGQAPVQVMSRVETTTVFADIPALVVVNERTGTIVMGGNVKLGPAVVAHGSLQVVIQQEVIVSQPAPLSQGQTVVTNQPEVAATEEAAQVGLLSPNASINDLARIFQTLRLAPRDIIAILQALREQGALKARIKVQ
jgi:flagellar P-ring protein precursor FlgI